MPRTTPGAERHPRNLASATLHADASPDWECRPTLIHERIHRWRDEAAVLRRRGSVDAAVLLESVAAELEEDLGRQEAQPELVDLAHAVDLSGYTRGHLRRMLMAGTLTDYGTPNRPLVRASDLPRKPSRPPLRYPIEPPPSRNAAHSISPE